MPKPPQGFTPPDFSGQTKIMFVNEGNPAAMVMTNRGGRRNVGAMQIGTAEAVLAWCRKNGVMLVYLPTRLETN